MLLLSGQHRRCRPPSAVAGGTSSGSPVFAIFCAFADAYCESNQYITESRDEIRNLAIACSVVSMSKGKSDCLLQAQFKHLIKQVRYADEYKDSLYWSIRGRPIALFFRHLHFHHELENVKRGTMLKNPGLFNKAKLYCALSEAILKVYKDERFSD
jgi:hypothetical protein